MDGHNKVKVVGKAVAHGTGRGSVDFLYGIPRALANANPYPTVPFAPRPSPREQEAYERALGKMDRSVEKWKDVAFPQPMYTGDPSAQLWSDSALAISEAVASTGGPMASARMVTGGAKLATEGGRALAKGVDYVAANSAMRPGYITITYPEWLRNLRNGTRSVAEVLPNTADLLKTADGEKLPLFVTRNGNIGYSRELNDMVTRWRNLSRNRDVTPGQQKIYREMSDFFAERLKAGGTAEAANKATLEKYGYQANIGGSLNATIARSVEKTSQGAMRKGLGVKSGTVYPARGENLNYDQLPSDIVPMVYEHLKTKGADVPINIGGVEFMVFKAGSRGSRPNFWSAKSPGAAAARSGMTADAPTASSFHLVSKERLGSQDGQYIVMTLTDHGIKGVSDISTMDERNVRKFISTIAGDNGFQVPGGTVGKTGATVPGPVIHVGSRQADNLILETEAGAKALNDVDDIFGPRVSGQETRQDAKGGQKSNSQLASFLATDDVPPTLFGIPVVQSEADYSEKDLAFFREHPEAGGFYRMGDETDEDQGAVKGGVAQQVRRDGAAGAPRDWARKETFKVLGLNEFGGNLDPGADRPHYYFRDADGKIEGYGTTRSGTFRDGDSFVVIPTIVNGELLSDGDAFDRYRKTGEHWAKTDTREAGDAVARRIHDRHEGRDRAKWNEYILGHWDEMSGKVTSDKWLRAEHTRRVSREAARTGSGADAVMSAGSPVRRDDKGGWSPYDNAEVAIAKALPFIKEHEKFVGKAYWDKVGGKWTVGHGHTRIRDAKTGKMRNVTGTDTMDEKTSSTLVESIVRHNAAQIYRNRVWSRNVGPDALAAMYDVAYNAGPSVFDEEHSPNLNSEMESADMDFDSIIWNAIPSYRTVGGKVIKGLENRRRDSLELWGPKPEQVAPATAGGTEIRTAGPMPGHR